MPAGTSAELPGRLEVAASARFWTAGSVAGAAAQGRPERAPVSVRRRCP